MSLLKKTIFIFVLIFSTILVVGGYFGFIPFVSDVAKTNTPRDLGIIPLRESVRLSQITDETNDLKSASATDEKLQEEIIRKEINIIKTKTPENKPLPASSASVNVSLSNAEVLSLLQKWNTAKSPIENGFQMRINSDDTVELSGLLNRARLSTALSEAKIEGTSVYSSLLSFMPAQVPFYVKGRVNVENNRVDLTAGEFEIGRMPLPVGESMVKSLEKWIENQISGMHVELLSFHKGKMNVKGSFPSELLF